MELKQALDCLRHHVDDAGSTHVKPITAKSTLVGWNVKGRLTFVHVTSYLNSVVDDDEAIDLAADLLQELGELQPGVDAEYVIRPITYAQYIAMTPSFDALRAYYGQFVADGTLSAVRSGIGIVALRQSTDEFFNDIPIRLWHKVKVMPSTRLDLWRELQGLASGKIAYALSDNTCISKAAAAMLVRGAA